VNKVERERCKWKTVENRSIESIKIQERKKGKNKQSE
jgi:hypothetical protein